MALKNTTSIGKTAEERVAEVLKSMGHTIIARNWRTRTCEIDIISKLHETVYFTEVKYRSSIANGSGLEYITRAKLRQMSYAALVWCVQEKYNGDCLLQAAETTSSNEGVTITEINAT